MITDLELVCSHFQVKNVIRLHGNGQDPKTGKYSTPGCYIKADNFISAVMEYNHWEETGERENIIFEHELEELKNGTWYKQ